MKKGLDEARELYLQHGREMLHERFPDLEARIAVGLAGHGSECYGYDDELSRDHDFSRGFCLWLTDEDDLRCAPLLQRACRELFPHSSGRKSALGEENTGVHRISDFYRRYTGCAGAPETEEHWLSLPANSLAEATNGEVWRDDLGDFTRIRNSLLSGMPEDVWRKKIAARALEMAQAGQYNYARCLHHGQPGAAQLALYAFVKASCSMVFLLNRRHEPYYKWVFRAMEDLPELSSLKDALVFLLRENADDTLRQGVVEDICAQVISQLHAQKLSDSTSPYLEPHAFSVQEHIVSRSLRMMHILEG